MTVIDIRKIEKAFEGYAAAGENGFKHFAVLLPLCERSGKIELLYEVRAAGLDRQPGEICFPGGLIEKGETPLECALRETEEEIGVRSDSIRIISGLDSVFSAGGSQIHCYLGVLNFEEVKISKDEVDEVFTVPVEEMIKAEPEIYESIMRQEPDPEFPYDRVTGGKMYPWRDGKAPVPVYDIEDSGGARRIIWGLTGRMTKQFLEVLKCSD
ncbi:MAG: NUDIX hydrolase [Lentihominibacter sp.]